MSKRQNKYYLEEARLKATVQHGCSKVILLSQNSNLDMNESKGSSDKSFSTILALKQFQECDLLSLLQKNKTLISSTKNLICWDLNSSKLWDLNSHLLDTKIQKWGTADATFQINNLNTPEARYHRQQTCDHYLLWNLWHWELEMWWPYHSWNCEMWSVAHD